MLLKSVATATSLILLTYWNLNSFEVTIMEFSIVLENIYFEEHVSVAASESF